MKKGSSFNLSSDIIVGHDSPSCTKGDEDYKEKRRPKGHDGKELQITIKKLWYQRSFLSCSADLGP